MTAGRVKVLMTADRGANFRGEKVFFDEARALQLVGQKACVLLDENDEPILPQTGIVEDGSDGSSGNQSAGGESDDKKSSKAKKKKSNGNANPFAIDGFNEQTITALNDAKITTPEELIAYVATGKTLAEITGIDAATAEQLAETYLRPE